MKRTVWAGVEWISRVHCAKKQNEGMFPLGLFFLCDSKTSVCVFGIRFATNSGQSLCSKHISRQMCNQPVQVWLFIYIIRHNVLSRQPIQTLARVNHHPDTTAIIIFFFAAWRG